MSNNHSPFRPKPSETPEEKAKRLGVPLIPAPTLPKAPSEPNPVRAVCGLCGLELRQTMGYSCPQSNCPSGLGPIGTM